METTKLIQVLDEMFLSFIRSEDFGNLTTEGRNDYVNAYEMLKDLFSAFEIQPSNQ